MHRLAFGDAVMTMFNTGDTAQRLTALDLMGRRRMKSAIPTLLKAAGGDDAKVRPASMKKIGELGSSDQLDSMIALFKVYSTSQDLSAGEQAIKTVCARADDRDASIRKLVAIMDDVNAAQKTGLIRIFGALGGNDALKAVRKAIDDSDAEPFCCLTLLFGLSLRKPLVDGVEQVAHSQPVFGRDPDGGVHAQREEIECVAFYLRGFGLVRDKQNARAFAPQHLRQLLVETAEPRSAVNDE